ncbi:MAG TPA: ATP-binding protein [Saprospiraceae bacterium]|nr:ATP-binding protein [Saprospiraceae bacterium]
MLNRHLLILVILFLPFSLLFSQIDSLVQVFKSLEEEKDLVATAIQICKKCDSSSLCLAPFTQYLNEPPVLNKKINGLLVVANQTFRFNKHALTIASARSGISKAKSLDVHHHLLGPLYLVTSNSQKFSNHLDSALIYIDLADKELHHQRAENIYWKIPHMRYLIYVELRDYKRADFYLQQSYHMVRNSSNRMDKGFVLYSLLEAKHNRGTKEEFNFYLDEFIRFKSSGPQGKMDAQHIGLVEFFSDKEEAEKVLEKRMALALADSSNYTIDVTYLALAEIYFHSGKYDKALKTLDAMNENEFLETTAQKERYQLYYDIYKATNQPEEAHQSIEKYMTIQDSSYQQILNNNIAELEVKYETEIKQREIVEKDLALSQARLSQRSYIGLSGLLGAGILTGMFFHRRKLKYQREMNAKEVELQTQKIKELEQKNILLSLNSLIEGQEAERLRIAQDLHDGLGGLLTTVKAHFNSIQREIENVRNLNVYDKTNQLIDEACVEVRRIAHDMVPYSIKISGLAGALEDLKQSIIVRGPACELEIHNVDPATIPENKSNMIFRIIQELTNNAVKHANASRIFIQLMQHEDTLHIMVEDNGKGFDINQVVSNRGLGLKSIDSRVNYLGGKINFDSSPGQGTIANIEIPLTGSKE